MSLRKYWEFIQRTLIPKGDITEQAVKSGVWVTLINVFDRVLQLAKLVVLARILAPSDFGLMGIALLTLATLEQFSQLGLDTALIQRKEERVDEYLNTAWSMKIVRGLVITGVAFVFAPLAAQFFSEPRATAIIRVIALAPLVRGFQNPGVMYLRKNLEFHKQFLYTLSSTIIEVIVAIGAAVVLQNVWALVFGSLAASVTTLGVSYLIHNYRPWPEFERDLAGELFGFGKWLTASGILIFLYSQGDDAFVGWFLGATALGFYQMAYRFSNAPASEITHIVSEVAFPVYSKLQSEAASLREAYFKTLRMTSVISIPAAVGIILVAPSFVRAFLDEQWLPIVAVMRILAVWGLTRSVGANMGPVFKSLGRPDIETKLQMLKVAIIAVTIFPATARWGIEGTAAVIVGNSLFITSPLSAYLVVSRIGGSMSRFLKVIGYPLLASLIMAGGIYSVDLLVEFDSSLVEFAAFVAAGGFVYLSAVLLLAKAFKYEVIDDVHMMIGGIKG